MGPVGIVVHATVVTNEIMKNSFAFIFTPLIAPEVEVNQMR